MKQKIKKFPELIPTFVKVTGVTGPLSWKGQQSITKYFKSSTKSSKDFLPQLVNALPKISNEEQLSYV